VACVFERLCYYYYYYYPCLMPSFEGNLLTQRQQVISLETRDSRLPYVENPESLSHLGLIRYQVVTLQKDRQTDRIPIANTRSQQYLSVQLWRVKNDMKFVCSTPTVDKCAYPVSTASVKNSILLLSYVVR